MKITKLLKKIASRLLSKSYLSSTKYLHYIENLEIDENIILLESQQGKNLNGNIYYILKELCENNKYSKFKVYVSVNKNFKEKTMNFLKNCSFDGYELVEMYTNKYYKIVASAKYLVNDTTFLPFFIKKEGQVYLNTWHGTPLKTLGKKVNNDYHNIGNVMKNFIATDYLLYPNDYTKDCMVEDYMLENIATNKIVISGYPRNSIFLNDEQAAIVKRKYQMDGRKTVAYMPTWRGVVGNKSINDQIYVIQSYLEEIESKLTEDVDFYVNLHPFVHSEIDFNGFRKIKPFPTDLETYEFLNACDVLITDYSSVFFDYATKRNKIILFTYDLEEYLEDRGLYVGLEELPFPQVRTVEELIKEINLDKDYDDSQFINKYCSNDRLDASSKLLDLLLFNETSDLNITNMKSNGKENILIYAGNLAKNGITTSILNLLNNLDRTKYNYFITFVSAKVAPNKETLRKLPDGINYIPITGKMNATISDKVHILLSRSSLFKYDFSNQIYDKLYKYEIKRCYGNIKFSHVIQFSGYEYRRQLMFGRFDCPKTIFVHNNMVQEISVRKNQNPHIIRYCYNHYDNVAIVTEDMREPTLNYCDDESKIKVVNNVIDYKTIIEKSQEEMQFDEITEANKSLEEIKDILNSSSKKFITVGRFSPEKGHMRLLEAFEKLYAENNDIYLFIIGGHGVLYKDTLDKVETLTSKENIIIIKSLSNPFPFVKACDYFIFPSFYEGLGLVMIEADILGLKVVSTDILGPRGFMNDHDGYLVESNNEGVYKGMYALLNDEVKKLQVDYEDYNKNAIRQFESLFS